MINQTSNYAGSLFYGALAIALIFVSAIVQGDGEAAIFAMWSAASAWLACWLGSFVRGNDNVSNVQVVIACTSIALTIFSAILALWALIEVSF